VNVFAVTYHLTHNLHQSDTC